MRGLTIKTGGGRITNVEPVLARGELLITSTMDAVTMCLTLDKEALSVIARYVELADKLDSLVALYDANGPLKEPAL